MVKKKYKNLVAGSVEFPPCPLNGGCLQIQKIRLFAEIDLGKTNANEMSRMVPRTTSPPVPEGGNPQT